MTFLLMVSIFVPILLFLIFFFLSKSNFTNKENASSFECGFSSYFYSRFSFSVHFFVVGLIFLFLDLELCCLLPMFNEESYSLKLNFFLIFFVLSLLLGLFIEWKEGKLDWHF